MAFDYDFAVRFLLVLLAIVILTVLILQYQKKNTKVSGKKESKEGKETFASYSEKGEKGKKKMHKEKYEDNQDTQDTQDNEDASNIKVHQPVKATAPANTQEKKKNEEYENEKEYDVNPTENENNDDYKAIDFETSKNNGDCFPKDRLTTEDLLPKDAANSVWAENNPAGQGDVKDQNFLQAGVHFGVDTVGQSLRNANMQLRSDPPIPKVDGLSPWMNTTIEYDTNRRFLEIGS